MGSLLTGWKSFCWSWYRLGSYLCPAGPPVLGGSAAAAAAWGLFSAWPDVMSSLLYPDETLGASSGWWGAPSPRWGGGGDAYLPSKDSFELTVSTSVLLSLWKELLFVRGEKPNLVCPPRGLWVVFVGVGIFVWCSGELEWSTRFSSFIGDTPFIEDDDSVLYPSLSLGLSTEEDILSTSSKVEEDDGEPRPAANGWRKQKWRNDHKTNTPGRKMNVQLWEQRSTLIVLYIFYKTEGPQVSNIEKGCLCSKDNRW